MGKFDFFIEFFQLKMCFCEYTIEEFPPKQSYEICIKCADLGKFNSKIHCIGIKPTNVYYGENIRSTDNDAVYVGLKSMTGYALPGGKLLFICENKHKFSYEASYRKCQKIKDTYSENSRNKIIELEEKIRLLTQKETLNSYDSLNTCEPSASCEPSAPYNTFSTSNQPNQFSYEQIPEAQVILDK